MVALFVLMCVRSYPRPVLCFDMDMDMGNDLMVPAGIEDEKGSCAEESPKVPIKVPPVHPRPAVVSWIGYSPTPRVN